MNIQNKLTNLFKEKKDNILSIYFTAGFPKIDSTLDIIKHLSESGVDFIEIGIPFSDPMADGPTIQRSSQRAIKSGINLAKTFKLIENFRENNGKTPVILMGYFNPIFQFGLKKFFQICKKVGVDGLIIVDLPPEEDSLIKNYTQQYNVYNIRLVTPTTNKERLSKISKSSKGFLYYVSIMGITGTKKPSISILKKSILKIKKNTKLPVLVGFGINNANQVKEINKFANGCVIGSAIINLIEDSKKGNYSIEKTLLEIKLFLSKIKKGN